MPVDIDSDEDLPAVPAAAPRKSLSKKEKVVAPPSPSPEPEPVAAPAKKRKSAAGDRSRDIVDENVAPSSTSKKGRKDTSNVSVEIQHEKEEAAATPGSVVFAREATWEVSIRNSYLSRTYMQLTSFLVVSSNLVLQRRLPPGGSVERNFEYNIDNSYANMVDPLRTPASTSCPSCASFSYRRQHLLHPSRSP